MLQDTDVRWQERRLYYLLGWWWSWYWANLITERMRRRPQWYSRLTLQQIYVSRRHQSYGEFVRDNKFLLPHPQHPCMQGHSESLGVCLLGAIMPFVGAKSWLLHTKSYFTFVVETCERDAIGTSWHLCNRAQRQGVNFGIINFHIIPVEAESKNSYWSDAATELQKLPITKML